MNLQKYKHLKQGKGALKKWLFPGLAGAVHMLPDLRGLLKSTQSKRQEAPRARVGVIWT